MKPDKTTIYDLFYNQRQFAVSLSQRPYVWTLEAQWRLLWQDIEDKAQAVLNGQTDIPHWSPDEFAGIPYSRTLPRYLSNQPSDSMTRSGRGMLWPVS
jgi:hypothetical protein